MTNEEIVIGQIIIHPDTFFKSKLKSDHFADIQCARAFSLLSQMFSEGVTPDLLSVSDRKSGIPVSWWAEKTTVQSSANYEFYETNIIEAYRIREVASLRSEITDWIKDNDSAEILEHIEAKLNEITSSSEKDRVYKANELAIPFINKLEQRYNSGGELPGLSTGIPALDDFTLGLQPRLKYQIGGRPSDGKSALMVTLLCNMGVNLGIKCGVFSLESSKEEVYQRMIANIGNINSQNLQTGLIGRASNFKSVSDANSKGFESNIWFYDVPNCSLAELQIQARRMVRQYGIQVLFIDYEQLIRLPGVSNRTERIEEVSISIKELARQLEIPIVSLAQLSRDSQNRRPTTADFFGSSQLEKDADGAILIYHKRNDDTNEVEETYLCIEKMRDGRTGQVPVYFNMPYVKFTEAAQRGYSEGREK